MSGNGKSDGPAGRPREGREAGGARRPRRNVVSFSMRLECPRVARPLLAFAAERDRLLIAAVTRVAVASLDRQRLGAVEPRAGMAPYPAGMDGGGGANPRST
jgi:hypothetical protein